MSKGTYTIVVISWVTGRGIILFEYLIFKSKSQLHSLTSCPFILVGVVFLSVFKITYEIHIIILFIN